MHSPSPKTVLGTLQSGHFGNTCFCDETEGGDKSSPSGRCYEHKPSILGLEM